MNKSLTESELEHLLSFVGYGSLDADVWFLGMEEAGGGEENIRARLKFRQVEDCAEAHRILDITKHHYGRRVIQRTWRGMCYIMLLLDGKIPDTESIRTYQAEYLGRFRESSLLCELMPIPKPSIGKWGYDSFIPQFASRQEYYEVVMPRRIKFLQQMIKDHRPKTVIGYGKQYWPKYQELFGAIKFSQNDQFLVARDENTVIVLTDHFTARTMNGQLGKVVSIIQNQS